MRNKPNRNTYAGRRAGAGAALNGPRLEMLASRSSPMAGQTYFLVDVVVPARRIVCSGGRVVSAFMVRCIRSCAPFCSGCPGTMRSMLMPSRIHHNDSRESLARPGFPNGLPLSERIARGRPYSRKMRSNARRVCGLSFKGGR
jgi:hypothetical protein